MLALAIMGLSAILPLQYAGHGDWVAPDDFPKMAIHNNEQGYSSFTLLVDPQGNVANCVITKSSGFSDLDDRTCMLVTKRAHFKPAKNENGQPSYGVYHSTVSWIAGSDTQVIQKWVRANPAPSLFDLSIPAPDITRRTRDVVNETVGVMVDENGQKKGCGVIPSRTTDNLGEAACQAAVAGWKPLPASNPNGRQVESIQTVVVRFVPTAH